MPACIGITLAIHGDVVDDHIGCAICGLWQTRRSMGWLKRWVRGHAPTIHPDQEVVREYGLLKHGLGDDTPGGVRIGETMNHTGHARI
jgi:hypothetical protein